ncbi:MAG: FUSC family protein [Mangrovimonas sp.]|nr:FUSC family protein [Mangrovimonas sp.]
MKKLFIIIALIAAVLALILSVLPLSNLAYIPSILALASGITALIIHKEKPGKKTISLAFLLTVIALCFSVYKSIFTVSEVGDTTEFEEKTAQSVEESIETLENEIDIIDEEPVVTNETETISIDTITKQIPSKKPDLNVPKIPKKEESAVEIEPEEF